MERRSTKLLFLLLIIAISIPAFAGTKRRDGVSIRKLVHHDLSLPLRNIPPAPWPAAVKRIHAVKPLPRPWPADKPVALNIDGAPQFSATPSLMAPTVSSQFNGLGSNNNYTVQSAPPDTNGDVGTQYYVQT